MRSGAALVALISAPACSEGTPAAAPVSAPLEHPYHFVDATDASGLGAFEQFNGDPEKPFILESIGAGVALFDPDGDGDLDAYLSNGSTLGEAPAGQAPRDALFTNDGTGKFVDRTEDAGLGSTGWTQGVRVVDLNGDGWQDVYLTCYGPNVLYLNRADGTFEDATAAARLGDSSWSTGACFLDHDLDGDLDLYIATYVDFDVERMLADPPVENYHGITVYKGPRGLPTAGDRFYANDGAGVFEDVSARVGVDDPQAFGFDVVTFDVNRDGWPDLFVANDSVANFLWRNDEGQGFTDTALVSGVALNMFGKAQSGMGAAVGDFDGDLIEDLYVTHFSHDYSTLYRGVGDGFFVDATHRLRLVTDVELDLAWGCGFEDFDNDGDLEIYAVNGHVYPQVDRVKVGLSYAQRSVLFELADGAFRVPPGAGGPGFAVARVSRGSAVGDIDGDGDLDLLIGNLDAPPTLLRNDGPAGNWITVCLVDTGTSRDAIGARLVARTGDREQLRLVGSGGGFLSSSDGRVHFGLGTAETLATLEVTWPDGEVEHFEELPASTVVTIERVEGAASRVRTPD